MASEGDLARIMAQLGQAAAGCRATLAQSSGQQRNAALTAAAARIRATSPAILAANARDMDAARARNLSAALLDRLQLNEGRVEAMARGIEDIVALPDPVGTITAEWTRPKGRGGGAGGVRARPRGGASHPPGGRGGGRVPAWSTDCSRLVCPKLRSSSCQLRTARGHDAAAWTGPST